MYQDSLVAVAFDMALNEVTAGAPLTAAQRSFLFQLLDEAIAEEIRESSSATTVKVKVPAPSSTSSSVTSSSSSSSHPPLDTLMYRYSEGVWTVLIPNAEVEVRDRQTGMEETVNVSLLKCQIHEPLRKKAPAKRNTKRARGAQ